MAGRIPQQFIDDLLARVNIIDLLSGRVEQFKRKGKNYSGLCPFHKEKTPSFSANQERQLYYCFGCGAGGNAIGFLMELDHMEFPQAIEELAKMIGLDVPSEALEHNFEQQQQLNTLYKTLEKAADFYAQQLRQHKNKDEAVNYLKTRGLSGKTANRFNIGFAPEGWSNLLDHLGATEENKKLLEAAGLLINNPDNKRQYDRFRHRIMFPIHDQRGRVIAFGGRVLGDDKPKYLNSPETECFHKSQELYGLYEARKQQQKLDRLLIVEGYMDVVGLAQHDIHYAVATLGTATSSHHLQRIFKTVPEIVFCFDGDDAGRAAAARALNTCLTVIQDKQKASFLFLPDGEDPDSLVQQEGQQAFSQRLDNALPLSDFFFKHYAQGLDMNSMDGRSQFSSLSLPLIKTMQAGVFQQMMLNKVAEITGLSTEQFELLQASNPTHTATTHLDNPAISQQHYQTSTAQTQNKRYNQPEKVAQTTKHGVHLQLAESIISLLLHFPKLANQCQLATEAQQLTEPNIDILFNLIEYLNKNPNARLGTLMVDWQEHPQLKQYLPQLQNLSHSQVVTDEPEAKKILSDALNKLKLRLLDEKINKITQQHEHSAEDKTELMLLINHRAKYK